MASSSCCCCWLLRAPFRSLTLTDLGRGVSSTTTKPPFTSFSSFSFVAYNSSPFFTSSSSTSSFLRPTHHRLYCSQNLSSSSSAAADDADETATTTDQDPPQEAVLKLISEVSKTEGRVGQTTNMVLGGTVTHDSTNEWLALDHKVNTYPTVRGFTAIGTGGDDFVQAMVIAVESVVQHPIPQGHVKQKMSSGGKYVSVNIGPIQVISSEQVQAVYNAMRRDVRMKYFL